MKLNTVSMKKYYTDLRINFQGVNMEVRRIMGGNIKEPLMSIINVKIIIRGTYQ